MNNNDESSDDEIDVKDNIFNYKGFFVENEIEDDEPKYYEFGAHFPYKELYNILLVLRENQKKIEKGKEIEKIIQIKNKKVKNRERNNTKNKKIENNLNNLIKIFKYKEKSRNIGINSQIDNQNEMTFFPKNNYKNNLSLKKENKNNTKSFNIYKTNSNHSNYLKIYKNIRNKISNRRLNKKYSLNNNHKHKKYNLNLNKIGKYSDKYILPNKNRNNLKPQNKILKINRTIYQDKNRIMNTYDLNLQKSFQALAKEIKNNSRKKSKLDTIKKNSNSKDFINKKANIRKNSFRKINEKINNSNLNKKNKNETIKIAKEDSLNKKNNLKRINHNVIATPLECILKSYKSKNNKYSPKIRHDIYGNKNNSSYKLSSKNKNNTDFKNFSNEKYIPPKFKKNLDKVKSKGLISISNDNINKNNYNNININDKNKLNKEKNFINQNSFNNNKTFPYINTDNVDKSNLNKKIDSKNGKDNLYYFLNNNDKNSRNKKNNDLIINNLSSINNTEYKKVKTINNNNFSKICSTLQTNNNTKYKNETINNKLFINFKKNKASKNKDKKKRIFIRFHNSSYKAKAYLAQLDNYDFTNYYSTTYIGKNKKSMQKKSYINNLPTNKSKQKINLIKGCIIKPNVNIKNNRKINLINAGVFNNNKKDSNDILTLNKLKKTKNNSMLIKNSKSENKNLLKKYESVINKKNNNINIRININNNNNIIYNKIINNRNNNSYLNNNNNDKNSLDKNIKKIIKMPSFNKTQNENYSRLLKKKIIDINSKNSQKLTNNKLNKDDKVKFINISFPKAKFLNIFNNKSKK